jgi:ferredoxin
MLSKATATAPPTRVRSRDTATGVRVMGVIVEVCIVCDDCSDACQPEIGTVAEARARARKEGFVRRRRKGKWCDLCRLCGKKDK